MLNKYNRRNLFTHETTGEENYISLKELYEGNGEKQEYQINALYINTKSKFGDSPIIASSGYLINLPNHLLDVVNEMLLDDELIDQINNGKIGFNIYQYEIPTRQGKFYSVNWVELA